MASSEKPTGPGSSRHAAPGGEAATRSVPAARDRPSPPPNNRLPARERAYHDLKYRILEGRLPPGTSLLETEVANLLSMSRTPVREALIKLEEEGLVDVRPRHGITVRALSPEELEEICEVFSTLEVKAAQLLARRGLSDEEYARLDNLLNQMERATQKPDIDRWSQLDNAFHSEIVALCGNARLQSMLRQLWDQQYRVRTAIAPLRPLPVDSDKEHRAILDAIRKGDEAEAARCHQFHRERADREALALLRNPRSA